MANQFNDGDNAGITIYYTSPAANATTAFKPVGPHFPWFSEPPYLNLPLFPGFPHAYWRLDETHIPESGDEHAAVLPLFL